MRPCQRHESSGASPMPLCGHAHAQADTHRHASLGRQEALTWRGSVGPRPEHAPLLLTAPVAGWLGRERAALHPVNCGARWGACNAGHVRAAGQRCLSWAPSTATDLPRVLPADRTALHCTAAASLHALQLLTPAAYPWRWPALRGWEGGWQLKRRRRRRGGWGAWVGVGVGGGGGGGGAFTGRRAPLALRCARCGLHGPPARTASLCGWGGWGAGARQPRKRAPSRSAAIIGAGAWGVAPATVCAIAAPASSRRGARTESEPSWEHERARSKYKRCGARCTRPPPPTAAPLLPRPTHRSS